MACRTPYPDLVYVTIAHILLGPVVSKACSLIKEMVVKRKSKTAFTHFVNHWT